MITRQELSLKNEWWVNNEYQLDEVKWPRRDLFSLIEDNLDHPLMLNIVGLRRVGKSTILKQLIGKLLDQQSFLWANTMLALLSHPVICLAHWQC